MRGFGFLTLAVCIAIGIGVALAPRTTGAAPSPVQHAIARTLAVRSVEITETLPNTRDLGGPAIYQAPDRWEQGALGVQSGSNPTRSVVIGTKVYILSIGQGGGVLRFLREPMTRLHYFAGESPADQEAFGPLLYARQGFDFHRVGTGWSFKLHNVVGQIQLTGGTLLLVNGYVSLATLDEVVLGRRLSYSLAYAHFDSAPLVVAPS